MKVNKIALSAIPLTVTPMLLSAAYLLAHAAVIGVDSSATVPDKRARPGDRRLGKLSAYLIACLVVAAELALISGMFFVDRLVGLSAVAGATFVFIAVFLLPRGLEAEMTRAREGWANGAELTDDDIRIGSRELIRRRQWQSWAASVMVLATVSALPTFLKDKPGSMPTLGTVMIYLAALSGLVFLAFAGRAIDALLPEAHFLTQLDAALRVGAGRPWMAEAARRSLRSHRRRRWGHGGALLLESLPALRRAFLLQLRQQPALCEEKALTAAQPLFDDLGAIAASRAGVSPSTATRQALHLVLRGELAPELTAAPEIRSLAEGAWDRDLRIAGGVLWVAPVNVVAVTAAFSALLTLATAVLGLIEKI
jgi:hypothetical protein